MAMYGHGPPWVCTDIQVIDFEDYHEIIEEGTARRQTAETKMNSSSSRSHSVFTITIEQKQLGIGIIRVI